MLHIAYILCVLSCYCQGQLSNEILYTSNPLIEVTTSPTTTTTTTPAPVTYDEQNLFTSNPIFIESNDLPDVVPLLTNNTASSTTIQTLASDVPAGTLPPDVSAGTLPPDVPAGTLPPDVPAGTLPPENNLLATPFSPSIESTTTNQRFNPVDFGQTEQPKPIPDEIQQPATSPLSEGTVFPEIIRQPEIFPQLQPVTLPEFQEPATFSIFDLFTEVQEPVPSPTPESPINFSEHRQPFDPTQSPIFSISPEIENGTDSLPSDTLPPKTIQELMELAIKNILPDSYKCGTQKARTSMQSGPICNIDEFPWLVLLKYHDYDHLDAGFRCTGTLISRRYIITAANCVLSQGKLIGPKTAVMGEYKLSSPLDCTQTFYGTECADKVVEIPITKTWVHPNYGIYNGCDNLALLSLERDVEFSSFIGPICLPNQNLKPPKVGNILITAGWGVTENGPEADIKTMTNVPVLSDYQCKSKFYLPQMYISENQICVGTDYQKDICRADYGGPVMSCDKKGNLQWYLEGVMSGGFGFGRLDSPNKYTRSPPYIEWILSTMALDTYHAY